MDSQLSDDGLPRFGTTLEQLSDLLTVQNPLLVGLLIGLQTIRVFCPSLDKHSEKWTRFAWSEHYRKNDLGVIRCNRRMHRNSNTTLPQKIRPSLPGPRKPTHYRFP